MARRHIERVSRRPRAVTVVRYVRPDLNQRDAAAVQTAILFLQGRLERTDTIEWALRMAPWDVVKRSAILALLGQPDSMKLREPWLSAWRLIEESWNEPIGDQYGIQQVIVQDRLRSGERSGALISAIVDLVTPRLKVEAYKTWHAHSYQLSQPPKTFRDLLHASLTSGDELDSTSHELAQVLEGLQEREFLLALANALDAAVMRGLDIGRRIGWKRVHLYLGRVYYVSVSEHGEESGERYGDGFGFAPSVKLLCLVVSRLFDLDQHSALGFVSRWKHTKSPIYLRLWAAMSRDPRVTPAAEVGQFLLRMDYGVFWDVNHHPEIAELRARRFAEFDDATQNAIIRRIRRKPPRSLWRGYLEEARIEDARLYWVVRELKRIEVAGATLSRNAKAWLDSHLRQVPELAEMNRIDEGFLDSDSPHWNRVVDRPDHSPDDLQGAVRLQALERSLDKGGVAALRASYDFGLSADGWLNENGNSIRVLNDIASTPDGGAQYPSVWERFGWAHRPPSDPTKADETRDLPAEAERVLTLIAELPDDVISKAIQGISNWLDSWKGYILSFPNWPEAWHRVWPIAAEATDAMQPSDEEPDLNVMAQANSDEPMELDTLNTPAGKLVGVFLAACPRLDNEPRPFDEAGDLANIREKVINATGRSGLIAKHRMIESLDYFLRSDEQWTKKHLLRPLRTDDPATLALWRAVARQTRFAAVLEIIGEDMAVRASDLRLGRKTRCSLAFSLVIESLHALREKREPAMPPPQVQQMLRLLEDEVRAHCAGAIVRFLTASHQPPGPLSPEDIFSSVVKLFLQQVWPQERSLASPAVSKALAQLPVAARGKFAKAVGIIERFLKPFDCWSIRLYGLYDSDDTGRANLGMIDDEPKGKALLRLLDLTISPEESAVIPLYLGDALGQIRQVAPALVQSRPYRRLQTAARRR